MSIETKLRDGSQAIRQATLEAEFTSVSPAQRRRVLSGPVFAWAAGLSVVALFAIPALVIDPGNAPIGSPNDAVPPLDQESEVIDTGIGADGPYFGVDDPSWTLQYVLGEADGSSFVLYENGERQISTMTGWVAEDAIQNIESYGGGSVTSGAGVTQYEWQEGLSYVWRTSSGQVVVVTFGQMTPDDAEASRTLVQSIDDSAFSEMLAENPPTPTTVVTAPANP